MIKAIICLFKGHKYERSHLFTQSSGGKILSVPKEKTYYVVQKCTCCGAELVEDKTYELPYFTKNGEVEKLSKELNLLVDHGGIQGSLADHYYW